MADVVLKTCDFKVDKRRTKACGNPVPDNEPTPVTIDTTRFLMDLCDEHKQALREALLPFTSVAHDTQQRRGTQVRKAVQTKGGQTFTTKDVRMWLQEQGREVPSAGRLSQDLLEEYKNAHVQ